MDGKKRARGGEKKAAKPVPPAGSGDAGAMRTKALLPDATAASPPVDDGSVAALEVEESGDGAGAGGVEEEVDDEQVERFYALLANIRALRGLPPHVSAPSASCGGGGADGGAARTKRLRTAEPPWRPAFRMEDFEEPAPAPSKRKRAELGDNCGESASGAPPVVVKPSSSLPHAAVRFEFDSGSNKN